MIHRHMNKQRQKDGDAYNTKVTNNGKSMYKSDADHRMKQLHGM